MEKTRTVLLNTHFTLILRHLQNKAKHKILKHVDEYMKELVKIIFGSTKE